MLLLFCPRRRSYIRKLVKYSEFRRWLVQQGAEFKKAPGGGSHQKVSLNGMRSIFPDHGSKEMPEPLRKKIMKDLGL
ncbi:type II toxin-antitoxin system HicA family toxin [Citrobacter freundii]|jgi:mRNA interferase HicA